MTDTGQDKKHRSRFRFPVWGIIPVAASALLGVFAWSLQHHTEILPSVMIGKLVPQFALPAITGRAEGFQTADLKGQVALVNIFASWCVPCRAEHPLITQLSRSGDVPIYGINYKDKAPDALAWLKELGDPYTRIGADTDGHVAIDFGSYGIPETYVVAADGTIVYRVVGPITQAILDQDLLPVIRGLQLSNGKVKK